MDDAPAKMEKDLSSETTVAIAEAVQVRDDLS
jgi:hypothetical protein